MRWLGAVLLLFLGVFAAGFLTVDGFPLIVLSAAVPWFFVLNMIPPMIWLERKGQANAAATNLAVWYDVKLKNGEGTKWLKDMRQWWRRTGRELQMPVDGITGATRAPGVHALSFPAEAAQLGALAPGDYELVVEAAREVGGRELLRLPLQWPPKAASASSAQGEHELGKIQLAVKP